MDDKSLIEETIEKQIAKSKFSKKALKHIETLKHFYKVDVDNKIITVPLHFNSVDDIIDPNIGDKDNLYLNQEILVKISKIAHTIPYEFYINVEIIIDDYQGYKHETVSKAIIDAFEMFHYDMVKEKNYSAMKVAMLIVIGFIVFTWLFYVCSKKWFGEAGQPNHDTLHEIVYTIAGVVLWEAVYIIFLPDDSYNDISYDLIYSIKNISLLDSNNKVLDVISSDSMNKAWKIDTRSEKRIRKFLLIMGTVLICSAVAKTTDFVEVFLIDSKVITKIIAILIVFISMAVSIIAGIGAISYYRDKGPFKKLVILFGIINSVILILELVLCIIIYNESLIKSISLASISLAISLLYTGCAIKLRKKDKE